MIRKTTLFLTKYLIFFAAFFAFESNLNAQGVITPQQFDGLEKLCAGVSFNEFFATFTYTNFPAGTTFAIELSDAAGNFTSPQATTLLQTTDVTSTQKTIKYAVPTNLIGSDIYSVRVKASTGETSVRFRNSLNSNSFPVFYKSFETAFFINNKSANATICTGGSLTLSVYNETPSVPNSSPATNSNLKYKWFKDDVLIAGQSSSTLVVNAVGVYYAQIDYGLCSDVNISSNRVTVNSSTSGTAVTIDSSLGNPFCSNGTGTVLTATSGNSYVWKKDGTVISGVTTRTYTTNESGTYSVEVDFGGCKATGSINLSSNGFNASVDIADDTTIAEGETISVTVTTDATSPTYEWYLNNTLISSATTDTYLIAVRGNYKVKISQATGCIATKELAFRVLGNSGPSGVIPNVIKLSGLNPYWNIPNEYKNASTNVMIISSNGDKVLDVVDYQGDWPQTAIDFKNVNPVYYYVIKGDAGEKKGSITVIK